MIGRNATAGLALLCALLFSAFATQSAFAQVGDSAINTTAVTCVEGGGEEDFSDAHCDDYVGPGEGPYGHEPIDNNVETAVDVTDDKDAVLKTTHLGVSVEIDCETVSSSNSYLENKESAGNMSVEGTVKVEFTNCKVTKPNNCVVKEPIETIAKAKGVEGLNYGVETEAMGVEFTQDGGNFANISFKNKEALKCVFDGKTFPVTGSAIATGTPEPIQDNHHSGATAIYESANEMDTLKFSTSNADFTGVFVTKMSSGGDPIALTTVT